MGWAFRLFDAQGVNASVRDEDRQVMTAAGLDASDIATVERHLGDLRRRRMVPTPRQRLERLVTGQAALPSEMNLASAQQVYFRALSLALFETDRRYAGVVPDAAKIVAAALRVDRSAAANAASMPAGSASLQPTATMTADEPPVTTTKAADAIQSFSKLTAPDHTHHAFLAASSAQLGNRTAAAAHAREVLQRRTDFYRPELPRDASLSAAFG